MKWKSFPFLALEVTQVLVTLTIWIFVLAAGYVPYNKSVSYEFEAGSIYKAGVNRSLIDRNSCTQFSQLKYTDIMYQLSKNGENRIGRTSNVWLYWLGTICFFALYAFKWVAILWLKEKLGGKTYCFTRLALNLSRVVYAPSYFVFTIVDYTNGCIKFYEPGVATWGISSVFSISKWYFFGILVFSILSLIIYCCNNNFEWHNSDTGRSEGQACGEGCQSFVYGGFLLVLLAFLVLSCLVFVSGFGGGTPSIVANSLMAANMGIEVLSIVIEMRND